MLSVFTITSLDQGKIWKDLCPLPREFTADGPLDTLELVESRWRLAAAVRALVARLLGKEDRARRV